MLDFATSIKGTITSVDSTTQFHMAVFNEEPSMNGISEGSQITVTIEPNAMFQVGREEMGEDGGFSKGGWGCGEDLSASGAAIGRSESGAKRTGYYRLSENGVEPLDSP